MAEKPAKAEQVLKIEPKNELHFKGEFCFLKFTLRLTEI